MSTIAAGTTSGTALVSTGDTTGALVIKTGGSATTAATFNADQTTTFAGAVSAPSFSGTSSTATNLAGGSNGTIPYQSASGTTQMLAVGTSGQVLQTNGVGAPSWVTPSTGALVLLSTQTVSSAVTYVTFSNVFNSTYNDYLIIFEAVAHNNSYPYSGGVFQMQIEKAGSFRTSGYNGQYGNVWASPTSSLSTAGSVSTSNRQDSNSNSGTLYCLGMNQTTYIKQKFLGYATNSGGVEGSWIEQQQNDGAVTGIRFLVESTNTTISQGSFYVYGIAKS